MNNNLFEKIKKNYAKLPKKQRIQLWIAILLTVTVICSFPTYAWFTRERKMAVMASINAPYTLFLSTGNQESMVYFDMSTVDVASGVTHKDYVFSVQGSWDINEYYVQLAHTTNIPFSYSVFRINNSDIRDAAGYASLSDELKDTTVSYTAHSANGSVSKGQTIYYTYRTNVTYAYENANAQYGKIMDSSNYVNKQNAANLGIKDSGNNYYSKTYGTTGTARVQKNAVPLYMQAGPIKKDAEALSGQDFCDYYVLRVDWSGTQVSNDKETDIIYITVVSSSLVH